MNQAKLLLEVARRVAEPVESLPGGARPAVLASLYRDAIFWGLSAESLTRGGGPASDPASAGTPAAQLAALWSALPSERLLKLAGDEAALATLRSVLLDRSPIDALKTTDEEAARARAFAEGLLFDLDAPRRAVEQVQVQRWTRLALFAAALLAIILAVGMLVRGPNLVKPKVFKTSSAYPECTPPNVCGELFFHTQPQESPWIDFDLGATKGVHLVEVVNRSDCCQERAIPLIIEVSLDDKQWTQVARRDTDFSTWTAKFPMHNARYVRLRVPRASTLHFDDVVVR